jgi:hypothetical protein
MAIVGRCFPIIDTPRLGVIVDSLSLPYLRSTFCLLFEVGWDGVVVV